MRILYLLALFSLTALAQLSPQQKIDDFRTIVSLYNKQYAPYEWKRDAVKFDMFNLGPWLDRIRATKDDLEYHEVLIQYVAALKDSHATYRMLSLHTATLGFTVDLYDNRVLIDSISRAQQPAATFPAAIGDEVVSVDGRSANDWIEHFLPFVSSANPRGARRVAAAWITARSQSFYPKLADLGETSKVVVKHRASGEEREYELKWTKSGTAFRQHGPVPDFFPSTSSAAVTPEQYAAAVDPLPEGLEPWKEVLYRLGNVAVPLNEQAVLGSGSTTPIFALPTDFAVRLGRSAADNFFSGTFQANGQRLGYIRIPRMTPVAATGNSTADFNRALQQFETEVAFMQQNTDGLILDVMRNPGGQVSYVEELSRRIIPTNFRSLGFEIRATYNWVAQLQQAVELSKLFGAEDWEIRSLEAILKDLETAYSENRGRTGPLSLTNVSLDTPPAAIVYRKPAIILTDEFSSSGGDMLPAVLQDNKRVQVVGMRSNGAGGSVTNNLGGYFSEGQTRVTQTLMNRIAPIVTDDLPAAPYVENVGVRPDVQLDYMTEENLLQQGRPFVNQVVEIIGRAIRENR